MGTRGRASGASQEAAGLVELVARPVAPVTLTSAQAELWFDIVNRLPAEWFTAENLPLLEAYCKCVDLHRVITTQLDSFELEWLKDEDGLRRFARLTEIQGRQAKLMKDLATSMRLTQQSRYRADKASSVERQSRGAKPWQREPLEYKPEASGTSPGLSAIAGSRKAS